MQPLHKADDARLALARLGPSRIERFFAFRALLAHATKSKLSPAEVCLELAALEKRGRDARNLAARTKAATIERAP